MNWLSVLGLALGLAMDAFAVAIAAGLSLSQVTPRQTFRLAFHFGLFQFMMPIFGWLGGRQLVDAISPYDHWVAFALLGVVGGKMLLEAGRPQDEASFSDPTRGVMLVTLSLATSMDALAVGLSMALIDVSMWGPSVVIGLVAATLTAIGIRYGSKLGASWGRKAEVAGGCILLAIGLHILLSHTLAPPA